MFLTLALFGLKRLLPVALSGRYLSALLPYLNILITDVILVALNGYMSYLSVIYISKSYTKMTPVLGISSVYISSSVLIAFVLMTVYSIKFVWQDVTSSGKEEK